MPANQMKTNDFQMQEKSEKENLHVNKTKLHFWIKFTVILIF